MKSIEDQARAFSKFDLATDIGTDLGSYRQGLFEGFLAGYRAAKAIVEEELQAVQAQRAEYPGLGAAQYALKNVLAKMGSK